MVLNYLVRLKESYMEKQLELSELLGKLEIQLQENEKLMKIMESSGDSIYHSFSSQSFENNLNKKYMEELNLQKGKLLSEHGETSKNLQSLQSEIELLENVIRQCKQEKNDYQEIEKQQKGKNDIFQELLKQDFQDKKNLTNFLDKNILQEIGSLFDKFKFAVQLYDLDKERCKLELSHLLHMGDSILRELKESVDEIYCEQENINLCQQLKGLLKTFKKNSHGKIHYFIDENFPEMTEIYNWYTIYLVKQLCNCTKEVFYAKKFSIQVKKISEGILIRLEVTNQNNKIDDVEHLIYEENHILFDIHKKVCLLSGNLEITCEEKNIIMNIKYPAV